MDAFEMGRCNSAAGGGRCGGRCGGAGARCGLVRGGLVRGCGLYVRTAGIHFCWVVACTPLGGIIACTMARQRGKRWSGGLASVRISGAASSAGSTPLSGGYFWFSSIRLASAGIWCQHSCPAERKLGDYEARAVKAIGGVFQSAHRFIIVEEWFEHRKRAPYPAD